MDDAIRKALEEAVDAAWPGDEAVYADEHDSADAMIAAAIAAFLDDLIAHARSVNNHSHAMTLEEMAAAVRRAAQGGSDG